MKTINKPSTRILAITSLCLLAITACSGGSSGGSNNTASTASTTSTTSSTTTSSNKKCGSSSLTADQTCLDIDGRGAIEYKAIGKTEYAGIAIFLHGAPGDPAKVSNIFDAKMIADKFGLISLAPQGNGTAYEWNSDNNNTETTDVDYLSSLIDLVLSQNQFADEKIYIFGYSAGGFMAYKLACHIPERLTAIISLAGQYRGGLNSCPTSTPIAVHHLHSPSDQDVPYSGRSNGNIRSVNETIEFWKLKNGCDSQTEITKQDGVTEKSSHTDTEKHLGCVNSLALSKLYSVDHEDSYIADKLLSIYEYLLK